MVTKSHLYPFTTEPVNKNDNDMHLLPLPATYIKIVPHQHSNAPPTILALDGPPIGDHSESGVYILDLASKPWAPFHT